jgi:hypothetical protein
MESLMTRLNKYQEASTPVCVNGLENATITYLCDDYIEVALTKVKEEKSVKRVFKEVVVIPISQNEICY